MINNVVSNELERNKTLIDKKEFHNSLKIYFIYYGCIKGILLVATTLYIMDTLKRYSKKLLKNYWKMIIIVYIMILIDLGSAIYGSII